MPRALNLQYILKKLEDNYWLKLSIEFANHKNYLDELYRVYPAIPEGLRNIDESIKNEIKKHFDNQDNKNLLKTLLSLELFPIKDPYVAYFRHDPTAIDRNPKTVNRLCGRLYELGFDEIIDRCSQPKEINRQLGPLFKKWISKNSLGIPLKEIKEFNEKDGDVILIGSEKELGNFARKVLSYNRKKDPDFLAYIKKKFILGETKFITDFGGHQAVNFEDAVALLNSNVKENVIKIAILDGVIYIPKNNKYFEFFLEDGKKYFIMSVLVLREFLHSL